MPNTVYGVNITNNIVTKIVNASLLSGSFPAQSNATYHLLTAPEVLNTDGFCTSMCGYHDFFYAWDSATHTSTNTSISFAWVGSPVLCPSIAPAYRSGCGALTVQNQSPNGNLNADNMVNIIAHETSEMATDPQKNAWSPESGDLCSVRLFCLSLPAAWCAP